jgi:hypothetical protein
MGQRQHGFTTIEMAVASALTLIITAVAIRLVDPLHAGFAARSEAVDMQQRLRVAAGTLYTDFVMAGAGPSRGPNTGSLVHFFAPVLPYRHGTNRDDAPGSFLTKTITLIYVPPTFAQTTLATVGPNAAAADIGVNSGTGCPQGDALCGFREGMSILIFDASGAFDTFSIADAQANVLHVESTGSSLTRTDYQPHTTTIVQGTSIVYSLKRDAAAGIYQLVASENGGADIPVVDHVVALEFEYYGESQPPEVIANAPPTAWATTYGPQPPALHEQIPTHGYPPGENCTFMIDPVTGLQVPRLAILGSGSTASRLVPLANAQLTDGPWCPDEANVNRWDADLLRIRRIGVTLRVQAANAAMRGPASVLFAFGGTSRSGNRWLPDLQVRFDVTPRNLALGR